jgi:hypothetical protein
LGRELEHGRQGNHQYSHALAGGARTGKTDWLSILLQKSKVMLCLKIARRALRPRRAIKG